MIVVIDNDLGNIGSVLNMLKKIGARAIISKKPDDLLNASKLILPGVGSFDDGIKNLVRYDYISTLNKLVLDDKVPILGICLGMQLMTRRSEEGSLDGLCWIDAEVKRFNFLKSDHHLKIPHMGWNEIKIEQKNSFFKNYKEKDRFYFVHSYHLVCHNLKNVLATTLHGYNFPSVIINENIIGTQFHPEKSHRYGMAFLKRFIKWDGTI
jgi:glutamine amidotransferase